MLSRREASHGVVATWVVASVALLVVLWVGIGASPTVNADDCLFTCTGSYMNDDYICFAGGPWYCQSCVLVCKGDPNNNG
jgi:hypothetical protein